MNNWPLGGLLVFNLFVIFFPNSSERTERTLVDRRFLEITGLSEFLAPPSKVIIIPLVLPDCVL